MVKLTVIITIIFFGNVGFCGKKFTGSNEVVNFLASTIDIGQFLNDAFDSIIDSNSEVTKQGFQELFDRIGSNYLNLARSLKELPAEIKLMIQNNFFRKELTSLKEHFERMIDEQKIIESGERKSFTRYKQIQRSMEQPLKTIYARARHLVGVLMSSIADNQGANFLIDRTICLEKKSLSESIYELFISYRIITVEYFTALKLIFTMLTHHDYNTYSQEIEQLREDVNRKYKQDIEKFKRIHIRAHRVLWNCDTGKNENALRFFEALDGSYYALDKFTKIWLIDEDLPNRYGTCEYGCDSDSAQYEDCLRRCGVFKVPSCRNSVPLRIHDFLEEPICYRIRDCPDVAYDCKPLAAGSQICLNIDPFGVARYKAIATAAQEFKCETRATVTISTGTEFACTCEESKYYVSTEFYEVCEQCGIGAIQLKVSMMQGSWYKLMHLRVAEGKLLPEAHLNYSSILWLPFNNSGIGAIELSGLESEPTIKRTNKISLSHFMAWKDEIITGIGFDYAESGHMFLKVKVSKFNYLEGKRYGQSYDFSLFVGSSKYSMDNQDIPIRAKEPHHFASNFDQYVEFTTSGDKEDGGQGTLPFIDTQPIFSQMISPITGVGLFIRGQERFGGYLTPLIYTYDVASHTNDYIKLEP